MDEYLVPMAIMWHDMLEALHVDVIMVALLRILSLVLVFLIGKIVEVVILFVVQEPSHRLMSNVDDHAMFLVLIIHDIHHGEDMVLVVHHADQER